ncbi:MAG TPA: CoA transferase [Actinomycetota bacterium]|nr:CoA transferase [Actinomycetota bacterium]
MRPLEGVRVADLSRVLAGPLCTMVLADLGADVVKVERPGVGDETRSWGPPFVGEDAAYFLSVNRGKRSVELDLKAEEGSRAARELILRSDVLVENFRPGTMERLGLDPESLRAEHPGLVVCSITAMGERADPRAAGYDLVMQAMTGLMSVTGPAGGEPTKVGVALLDVIAGLYAATGIAAALRERERTGRGRHVSVSLFDAGVAALVNQAANHLLGQEVPGPMGNAHPNIAPYESLRARGGPLILAAANDGLFARACEVLGRPALPADPRFARNADRVRNRTALREVLEEALATRTPDEWVRRLIEAGVPAAPVRDLAAVFGSEEGRAAIQDIEDPVRGLLRLVRSPILIDGADPTATRPPPLLGEHTHELEEGS